jgi:hypothetical protein
MPKRALAPVQQIMATKTKLCDVNEAAKEKLPGRIDDKSGIGVHYMDAYLKPLNAKLPDGTMVKAKRRGLKVTLQAGTKKGDGIMRRLQVSPDPVVMLQAALQEAARNAGVELSIEGGAVYITA